MLIKDEYEIDVTVSRTDYYLLIWTVLAIILFNTVYLIIPWFFTDSGSGRYLLLGLLFFTTVSVFVRVFQKAWQQYETAYFILGIIMLVFMIRASHFGHLVLGLNLQEMNERLFMSISAVMDIGGWLILLLAGVSVFYQKEIKLMKPWPALNRIKRSILLFFAVYSALFFFLIGSRFGFGSFWGVEAGINAKIGYMEAVKCMIITILIYMMNIKPEKL